MSNDFDLIRAMLDPTLTEDECREQTTARPEDKLFGGIAPDRLDSDPDVVPPPAADEFDDGAFWT